MASVKTLTLTLVLVASVALLSAVLPGADAQTDYLDVPVGCPKAIGGLVPYPGLVPCYGDCTRQHNATGGYCDEHNTCICTGTGESTSPPWVNCTGYQLAVGVDFVTPLCLCYSGINASIVTQTLEQQACDADCKCNHGARSGLCHYEIRQCVCDYPAGFQYVPVPDQLACWIALMGETQLACYTSFIANGGVIPEGC